MNLAPAGNPEASPIAQTKPPTPGTRNKGRMNGSSITPINLTTPKLINNSEKIKKGRREGKTIVHHMFKPPLEASKDSWGKIIKPTAIMVTVMANTIVLDFDLSKVKPPPKRVTNAQ